MAYARLFPVAEVNSTFYALPKTSTARAWRKSVDEVRKSFGGERVLDGITLHVKKGDALCTFYTETPFRLNLALKTLKKKKIFEITPQ